MALFVLASAALVEIVIGRTNLAWRLMPKHDIGILLNMEERVIHKSPAPRVVILGTSRRGPRFCQP
ncbi:MAG: hypothetical protein FJW37_12865 [Acidobacteria bacterium]|nr:hypothetical protein [Acidobacteriota bacterium]